MSSSSLSTDVVGRFLDVLKQRAELSRDDEKEVCAVLSEQTSIGLPDVSSMETHLEQIAMRISASVVGSIQARLGISNEVILRVLDPTFSMPIMNLSAANEESREIQGAELNEQMGAEFRQPKLAKVSSLLAEISSSKSDDQRDKIVESLTSDSAVPPVSVLNALVSATQDPVRADRWLSVLTSLGTPANHITFNVLLRKSFDESRRTLLLTKMQEQRVPPNSHIFATLIGGSDKYTTARHFWDLLVQSEVPPNDYHVSALMGRVRIFEEAMDALKALKDQGICLNAKSYGMAISKATSDREIVKLFEEMELNDVKLNEAVIGTSIARVAEFGSVMTILKRQSLTEIPFDQRSISKLINLASSRLELMEAIKLISNLQGGERRIAFDAALSKVADFDSGIVVITDAVELGVPLDIRSFGRIASLSRNIDQALLVLNLVARAGQRINTIIMNTVISKCDSFDRARKQIKIMVDEGVEPNARTINTALSKTPNFHTAMDYLREAHEMAVVLDTVTFNTVIGKARSLRDAKAALRLLQAKGELEPDVVTYANMLSASESAEDVNTVFELWLEKELEGQFFLQKACVRFSLFASAEDLLSWYFGVVAPRVQSLPLKHFGQVVDFYITNGSVDNALRIAMAFPHLEQSVDVMKSHFERAVSLFRFYYESDRNEAHNAAYALAKAYQATDNKIEMQVWASIALQYGGQAQKRLDDIIDMTAS